MTDLIDHAKRLLGLVDSAEAEANRLIDAFVVETAAVQAYALKPKDYAAARAILDAPPEVQVAVLTRLCERAVAENDHRVVHRLDKLSSALFARTLPVTAPALERLMASCRAHDEKGQSYVCQRWSGVACAAQHFLEAGNVLTSPMREALAQAQVRLSPQTHADFRKVKGAVAELLGDSQAGLPDPGERWAEAARLEAKASAAWVAIFAHAATAESGKPSTKWLAEAEKNRHAVGETEFRECVTAWLNMAAPPPPFTASPPPLPPEFRSLDGGQWAKAFQQFREENKEAFDAYAKARADHFNSISEKNIATLKGLSWYSSACDSAELARALAHMAEAAFQNIPERGAWAKSAGNAALWALGQMPGGVGVAPLARLRTRLRDRGALKLIASSIEAAAKSANMTVDELEDLAVPTGGLDKDGTRRETFGAEADGSDVSRVPPAGG